MAKIRTDDKKTIVPATRLFTDRESPKKTFKDRLAITNETDYNIIFYYGVGGIGKTSLQKHLKEAHLDRDKDAIYSWVDFYIAKNRSTHKALRLLSQNFQVKEKISFTAFDIAYSIYWSKAFPEQDLSKAKLPFIEEGNLLSGVVGLFEDTSAVSVGLSLISYAADKIKQFSFDLKLQEQLKALEQLEADAIEDKLPYFFNKDINKYKENNPEKKVVIFLDTYEALWMDKRTDANALSQDEWIRDSLISESKNILFVICGREKLRWSEETPAWEEKDTRGIAELDQHRVGYLSKKDMRYFLDSCDINEVAIQDEIVASAKGIPFYLDLCVDIYYEIKSKKEIPTPEDFLNVKQEKIFERFMRYLDKDEHKTLYALAHARYFDEEIFELLVQKFSPAHCISDLDAINRFSFITQDGDEYYIDGLMRESLLKAQSDTQNIRAYEFLCEYYNKCLINLDIIHHPQESVEVLNEAVYSHLQLYELGVHESLEKFRKTIFIFLKAYALNSTKFSLHIITIFENLASLYISLGSYASAFDIYEQSSAIKERHLGLKHPSTVNSYTNLAILSCYRGNIRNALSIAKKCLDKDSDLYQKILSLSQ